MTACRGTTRRDAGSRRSVGVRCWIARGANDLGLPRNASAHIRHELFTRFRLAFLSNPTWHTKIEAFVKLMNSKMRLRQARPCQCGDAMALWRSASQRQRAVSDRLRKNKKKITSDWRESKKHIIQENAAGSGTRSLGPM